MPARSSDLTLVGFIVAACVALALLGATQWLAWQERHAAERVVRDLQVLREIADTRTALVDIQNGHRGYMVEGTQEALQPYLQGTQAIRSSVALLRQLLSAQPRQQAHLAELERLLPLRLASAARIVESRRTQGFEAARRIVADGDPTREMAALRAVLDRMDREQEALVRERAAEQRAILSQLAVGAGAITLLLFPGLALLYRQIRLRAANADLERAKLQLQEMAARIVEYQEQERRRLAYELHEDMAQSMTAIRIDLLQALDNPGGGYLTEAVELLDALVAQTRDMVGRLRPTMLDDLGLPDALEGELAYHARRAGWKTQLRVEPRDFPALAPNLATACFRVAQEALYNCARHARATQVEVALLMRDGDLELTVEDDGAGITVASEGFGITFMRERARQVGGSVEITPGNADRGVRVRLLARRAPG